MDGYLGFIEFFVVALFAMAWGVLELVGRRLDKGGRTGEGAKRAAFVLSRTSSAVPGACGTATWPARSAS
jgi:hypothetical protein